MRDFLRQSVSVSHGPGETPGGREQRSAPRFTLLIRAAKLVNGDAEYLCIVRDVSESGLSVRLFHSLPAAGELTLELPNGDRHMLERVWEEPGRAGFRFVGKPDLERLIEGPSPYGKRGVRVRLQVPCELLLGTTAVPATIVDLSQQGARISTLERLALLQRVKVRAEGMPEITGKVRWRRGDDHGLTFEDTLQFTQLAELAFDLQRTAGSPPEA